MVVWQAITLYFMKHNQDMSSGDLNQLLKSLTKDRYCAQETKPSWSIRLTRCPPLTCLEKIFQAFGYIWGLKRMHTRYSSTSSLISVYKVDGQSPVEEQLGKLLNSPPSCSLRSHPCLLIAGAYRCKSPPSWHAVVPLMDHSPCLYWA